METSIGLDRISFYHLVQDCYLRPAVEQNVVGSVETLLFR